jgi:hypothetical protein
MACTAGPSVVPLDDIGTVLAPDVTLIAGGFVPGLQPDGNTVIFRGREGLLVFDSGRHAEHSQRILDYAEQSHTAIAAVVNVRPRRQALNPPGPTSSRASLGCSGSR